jgi:iron complex outermembrane receptor protein
LGVYGSWAQGFLPPTTEELVNNPATYGGFNQALVPAISIGGELGVRGLVVAGLSYELSGFVVDTHDDFDRYRISSRPGLTFYRNSGDSRRYGVETRLGWSPARRLTADLAYTWSHFRYTAPDSLQDHWLPNSPEHMLSFEVAYELVPRLTVGIETAMQSDWQVDPQNSATVAGFALWGARLAYRWRLAGMEGDAAVAGRNVFGASYMAFTEPDPDGNSYQPGPRQAVYAGITMGW